MRPRLQVMKFGGTSVGDAECIAIDLATGERLGASDARNENGRAVGY